MSAQFGRWNFDGEPTPAGFMEKVQTLLLPYGPDGEGRFSRDGISLLYRAFHTTKESRLETQPHVLSGGAVLMWDGRLDNRQALIDELRGRLSSRDTDIAIVAAAYAHWNTGCFQKLLGDWALAIWDPRKRLLLLAKDFIGTRRLYYSIHHDHVMWSTIIDPLVVLTKENLVLDEEYIAGWFSSFPAAHLTPYTRIRAVPPACVVTLSQGRHAVRKYWEFNGSKQIRYRTDGDYEEHFRSLFEESVRRRLRTDSSILAELSGGMDSSSIVCMADHLTANETVEVPRIETVSYYNDDEPHWNERPYFTVVEEKRGKVGLHIDVSSQPSQEWTSNGRLALWPGTRKSASSAELLERIKQQGLRVLLSGIGGDEFLGGVPTALPELEDLLAQRQFLALAHRLKIWALIQRRPWFHLLRESAVGFLPPTFVARPKHKRPPEWLSSSFVRRQRLSLLSYEKRWKLFGPLPSFQENISALDALRRQLACTEVCPECPQEKRYPFFDRDLLEFIFSIPRDQIVRPAQRRSLMRRALQGIVPDEILQRRRKAYVTRSPLETIATQSRLLLADGHELALGSFGVVIPVLFFQRIEDARAGKPVSTIPLLRALGLEQWLRNLETRGFLHGVTVRTPQSFLDHPAAEVVSA